MAYVYGHMRLDNNKYFYIGIGSDSKYKRANERSRRSKFWKNITTKYNYKVIIIHDNITYDEAKIKEIELIKLYGRIDNNSGILCNMTDGGDGTKNKIINSEYRKKLSIAAKKRDNKDAYKRMLEGRKKYIITNEHRLKLSNYAKNRIITQKSRDCSRLNMLNNNPSKNKLGKDSINYKYDVECYKDGKLINTYHGVNEAARNLNLQATKICSVINGKRNHTGGYTFKKVL